MYNFAKKQALYYIYLYLNIYFMTYRFKTYYMRIWPSQCSAVGQYLTVNKMVVVVGMIQIKLNLKKSYFSPGGGKVRFSFAGSGKTNHPTHNVWNSSKKRELSA